MAHSFYNEQEFISGLLNSKVDYWYLKENILDIIFEAYAHTKRTIEDLEQENKNLKDFIESQRQIIKELRRVKRGNNEK